MLKTVDSILLTAWKVVLIAIKAFSFMLAFVFRIIKAGLKQLGQFPFFAGLADHHILKNMTSSRSFEYIVEKCNDYGKIFSTKMLTSRIFRRCIFLSAFMLYLLVVYPPSHWGPWRKYKTGVASYYSEGFWFKKTASGERFLPFLYTAAHKTLPLGITVKVKNLENGEVVYVKINDRGPFVKGRIIDLSSSAAKQIGVFKPGTAKVAIYTRKKY
jgi:peptidoglycan lytic transglycosylase